MKIQNKQTNKYAWLYTWAHAAYKTLSPAYFMKPNSVTWSPWESEICSLYDEVSQELPVLLACFINPGSSILNNTQDRSQIRVCAWQYVTLERLSLMKDTQSPSGTHFCSFGRRLKQATESEQQIVMVAEFFIRVRRPRMTQNSLPLKQELT